MMNRTLEENRCDKTYRRMGKERIDIRVVEIPKREAQPGSAGLKTQLPGVCATGSALAFFGDSLIERDRR